MPTSAPGIPFDEWSGPRSLTGSIAPQGFRRTEGSRATWRTNKLGGRFVYVDSAVGSNNNLGVSWERSRADANNLPGSHPANSTFFISSTHSEAWSAYPTISLYGGYWISATKTEPPVPTAGAVISHNAGYTLQFSGSGYVYGVTARGNSGGSASRIDLTPGQAAAQCWESSRFECLSTGVNSTLVIFSDPFGSSTVIWRDVWIKSASSYFKMMANNGTFWWEGGGIDPASYQCTKLFELGSGDTEDGPKLYLSGLDLARASNGIGLFHQGGACGNVLAVIRDSKLPSGWVGDLSTATSSGGARFEMYNCDSGDTNYKILIQDGRGSLREETTLVRTGGASDGTTPFAWRINGRTGSYGLYAPFFSPEMMIWNESTDGSAKTVTVELLHNSIGQGTDGRLRNDEVGLEVMSCDTAGNPLGVWQRSRGDYSPTLEGYTDLTDSGASWTTTGMTNPKAQKISVTINPRAKGWTIARLATTYLGAQSLYACPKLTVS